MSRLGVMFKDISGKILDCSFIENKVYVPQFETVECVKDEIKTVLLLKGLQISLYYTNVLKY